ncbi:MAG: GNAT family N-acetyltransferase [Steroidobacteraceae bacterium]
MNLTLRLPEPADYAEIATWIPDAKACARWAGPNLLFPFTSTELQERLSVSGGQSYCLVKVSSIALGFGQYWALTPGSVHLGRIIVSPALRGQGAGRLLCEQLIELAVRATDANTVTLRVYRDNDFARKLYAKLGFEPVEAESAGDVLFMKKHVSV